MMITTQKEGIEKVNVKEGPEKKIKIIMNMQDQQKNYLPD